MARTSKPLFHISLGDGDQWLVEVEWPDGTLDEIRRFKHHASAAEWVATQSDAWLQAKGLFSGQTV